MLEHKVRRMYEKKTLRGYLRAPGSLVSSKTLFVSGRFRKYIVREIIVVV